MTRKTTRPGHRLELRCKRVEASAIHDALGRLGWLPHQSVKLEGFTLRGDRSDLVILRNYIERFASRYRDGVASELRRCLSNEPA